MISKKGSHEKYEKDGIRAIIPNPRGKGNEQRAGKVPAQADGAVTASTKSTNA